MFDAFLSWTNRNYRFTMTNLVVTALFLALSIPTKNFLWMVVPAVVLAFSLAARWGWLPAIVDGLMDFGKWLWSVAKQLWVLAMANKAMTWIIISVAVAVMSFLKADWATFWLATISTIAGFITFFEGWGSLGKLVGKISTRMISGRWGRTTQGLTIGFPLFIVGLVMMGYKAVAGLGTLLAMAGFVAITATLFGGFASKVNNWNANNSHKKAKK